MHIRHDSFTTPSNPDIPIWRYMEFAKFVDMLESSKLYFSRLDKVGDRFEGTVSDETVRQFSESALDNLSDHISERSKDKDSETIWNRIAELGLNRDVAQLSTQHFIDIQSRFRYYFYVNCWHMNENESVAMWKIYGNKGVAVQSTYRQLCKSFTMGTMPVLIGEVRYKDFTKDLIHWHNLFDPMLTKRRSFAYERELRAAFIEIPEDGSWSTKARKDLENDQRQGIHVPVELDTMIVRVLASPGRPEWFRKLVESVLKTYNIDKPVTASSLDGRPNLA